MKKEHFNWLCLGEENRVRVKTAVFWDAAPCSLAEIG
jgi:hypothetical protein